MIHHILHYNNFPIPYVFPYVFPIGALLGIQCTINPLGENLVGPRLVTGKSNPVLKEW